MKRRAIVPTTPLRSLVLRHPLGIGRKKKTKRVKHADKRHGQGEAGWGRTLPTQQRRIHTVTCERGSSCVLTTHHIRTLGHDEANQRAARGETHSAEPQRTRLKVLRFISSSFFSCRCPESAPLPSFLPLPFFPSSFLPPPAVSLHLLPPFSKMLPRPAHVATVTVTERETSGKWAGEGASHVT